MKNKIVLTCVALLGLVGVWGASVWSTRAVARSSTMPPYPHIVYLTSADTAHGWLTPEVIEEYGGSNWQTWHKVIDASKEKPLDAILVEEANFAHMTDTERVWLRKQIEDGVIVVGIGIDIEPFSASLGLPNLRTEGEASVPIGEDGYYLFGAILLGAPEDLETMRDENWLEQSILDKPVQINTQNPLHGEWGTSRGKLATKQEVDRFFVDLMTWIEDMYDSRSNYQQLISES